MKQYLDLLQTIKDKGIHKPAARENMPGTTSRFGHQFRCELNEGFPILTTKKVSFKNIVVELLWFLKGDTNIKFLVDNGCNIWNEDAYNYYCKYASQNEADMSAIMYDNGDGTERMYTFKEFVDIIKTYDSGVLKVMTWHDYKMGDCGFQYGKVWRDWEAGQIVPEISNVICKYTLSNIDQIKVLIEGLKRNPESRRHIVTAIDPVHDNKLALYWCHAMFQFNCRPIEHWYKSKVLTEQFKLDLRPSEVDEKYKELGLPEYFLDCQLYQRSADSFLGVPYNISSYALLTSIIARVCNMIPGEYIHSFGDVHIYDNHQDAVKEQLSREPKDLPQLLMRDDFHYLCDLFNEKDSDITVNKLLDELVVGMFKLNGYNPHPAIKAELSTGMKK